MLYAFLSHILGHVHRKQRVCYVAPCSVPSRLIYIRQLSTTTKIDGINKRRNPIAYGALRFGTTEPHDTGHITTWLAVSWFACFRQHEKLASPRAGSRGKPSFFFFTGALCLCNTLHTTCNIDLFTAALGGSMEGFLRDIRRSHAMMGIHFYYLLYS